MKQNKRLLVVILAIAVAITTIITPLATVFAEEIREPVDEKQLCTMTIQLDVIGMGKDSATNRELNIIQVATLNNGDFILKDSFMDIKSDINHLQNASDTEKIAKEIEQIITTKNIKPSISKEKTDANGKLVITDLATGMYLVYAEPVPDDRKVEYIIPSLVVMPVWNSQQMKYAYNIKVEPKHTPTPEEPPREGYNTNFDNRKMIFSVIVGSITLIFAL